MTDAAPTSSRKPVAERFFYSAAAIVLLVLTVIGFRLFYFHGQAYPGQSLTQPIRTLVISHGLAMSVWILFGIVQPFLVAGGNRRLHMALGRVGALIAIVVFVLGVKLAIESTRVSSPGPVFGPLTARQFMAIPFLTVVLFAIFVAIGVTFRKRPAIHRPMMFMASMAVVGAAIARIDFFNRLYAGTVFEKIFGVYFFTVVVAGAVFLAKCIAFRSLDRWFAAGFGMLTLWLILIAQCTTTPAWDAIAGFLLR
jgi:hypothetical protein